MCLQVTFQVLETECSFTPKYDSFLHASIFISCLDVDFLSIERDKNFLTIATDGRHLLRSRFIHKLLQIARRFICAILHNLGVKGMVLCTCT